MNNKGLGNLRKLLPRGYGKIFAEYFNCSRVKIYRVASGSLTDYRILKMLKETAEKKILLAESINKLTQSISKLNKKL